jgi:hypothetical protein
LPAQSALLVQTPHCPLLSQYGDFEEKHGALADVPSSPSQAVHV